MSGATRPAVRTTPRDGCVTPAMRRSRVVFPAPFRPIMPIVSPRPTARSMSRRASIGDRVGRVNGSRERSSMARSSSFQYRFETLRSSIAGMAASEEVNEEPIVSSMQFNAADEQHHGHDARDDDRTMPGLELAEHGEVEQVDDAGHRIEIQPRAQVR